MRKVASTQSKFKAPLNYILSTEASVRLLRSIATSEQPLSKAEAAHRSGVTPAGARRALERLIQTGIVEEVGVGREQSVTLRKQHYLASHIAELFEMERSRSELIIDAIGKVASRLRPRPKSVWIVEPIVPETLYPLLEVRFVASSGHVDKQADQLAVSLSQLERDFGVAIETTGLTIADLMVRGTQDLSESDLVFGVDPQDLISPPRTESKGFNHHHNHDHGDRDDHAARLAHAIVKRIRKDPSIIVEAKRFIKRRIPEASPGERRELLEWQRILNTSSQARLEHILTGRGERATRLRQTMPFVNALSPSERRALIRESAHDA
jgi:hypothetical protein